MIFLYFDNKVILIFSRTNCPKYTDSSYCGIGGFKLLPFNLNKHLIECLFSASEKLKVRVTAL